MIALCGCMMQEPEVVAKIKKSYRHVDLIFGTHNIFKLAELLYERFMEKKICLLCTSGISGEPVRRKTAGPEKESSGIFKLSAGS